MTTKARAATDPDDVNGQGLARRHLRRCLHDSLRRLGRDSVDLYQLHGWDGITPVEEALSFLDDAVHAGEINYIGLSNFTGWQLQLMLSTAEAMGVQVPVTLQVQYNLLSRDSDFEILPAARYNDIGILSWSPLAGGLLSGKYTRGAGPAGNTRAGSGNRSRSGPPPPTCPPTSPGTPSRPSSRSPTRSAPPQRRSRCAG